MDYAIAQSYSFDLIIFITCSWEGVSWTDVSECSGFVIGIGHSPI